MRAHQSSLCLYSNLTCSKDGRITFFLLFIIIKLECYILSILIKQCREHINTFSSYFTPTQYVYINVNIKK